MAPGNNRIALVDDQLALRFGLEQMLAGWSHGEVVLHAESRAAYEKAIANHPRIHLAIINLRMLDGQGFEIMRRIKQRKDRTFPVAIAHRPTEDEEARALASGARAVFCTSTTVKELHRILKQVLDGVLQYDKRFEQYITRRHKREASTPEQRIACLTKRERQFLLLWARPPYPSLQQVAKSMGRKCVESLRKKVCERLGLKKQMELAAMVRQYGIR